MSMRELAVLLAVVLAVTAARAETPNLGRVATPEEIKAYDISADPNGDGLPPGSGTAKQGEAIYAAKCLSCHGERGVGGQADRLAGGQGTLTGEKRPIKTVGSYWPYATSVFAYIRRAMPFNEPKSLTPDETYAVTAYLLSINGILKDDDVMNAQSLSKVQMPNRDGFFPFAKPN
jgi:S-disulfanyl-L-cysteine oxidoreductase SoxD